MVSSVSFWPTLLWLLASSSASMKVRRSMMCSLRSRRHTARKINKQQQARWQPASSAGKARAR